MANAVARLSSVPVTLGASRNEIELKLHTRTAKRKVGSQFSQTFEKRDKTLETLTGRNLETEQELRHARDQMAAFLESAPISLHWVAEDGTILWANQAEMDLLGYSPEEYIGRNITEFHADQDVIEDILMRLIRDEKLQSYPAVLKCKDGSRRMVVIDSSVFWEDGQFVHSQCFTRDVTSERALEATNRLRGAIIESCDDAVISKDLNGVITSWNGGAERIFGYTASEAIGKPVMMLIPGNRHNEEPEVLNKIRSGQRIDHYETVRQRKDGKLIDISLTVSPVVDSTGRLIGAAQIARDISGAKRDQKRLKELANELEVSRRELEQRVEERTASLQEALAQMEEFSYTVSHDLRAPLRAMNMYSQVLLESFGDTIASSKDAQHYLRRISENCSRLDQMILDVLAFGRVARGQIALKPVSLNEVVTQPIDNEPMLQEPISQFEVSELGRVMAHEPTLFQAVSNILINAAKFVSPGTKPRIKIWSVDAESRIRLWIEDNGIGIDPLLQHRLFDIFERVHPDLGYEGTGVGLAIVRKAIMRMGGQVGVESDGTNGSRFWIELPRAELN